MKSLISILSFLFLFLSQAKTNEKLGYDSDISDNKEKAIVRLVASIKYENFATFYNLLEANNNELIKNLISHLQDRVIVYGGNNYSGLMGVLLQMYSKYPNSWTTRMPNNIPVEHYFIDRYLTKPNVKITNITELLQGNSEIYWQSFVYDADTGNIILEQNKGKIQALGGYGNIVLYSMSSSPSIIKHTEVSPLSPVLIDFNEDIAVVELLLDNAGYQQGNVVIVPAIFLQYGLDKIEASAKEKSSLFALNAVTIGTGLPAVIQGATLAKRVWAAAEVAGALGDIVANTNNVEQNYPKLKNVIDIYNGAMGLIGIKNLVTSDGVVNLYKNADKAIKEAFEQKTGIKANLTAYYLNWKTAATNLDNLTDAERQLVNKQEQVWKGLLGINTTRYIAKTGEELKTYLNGLTDLPKGITYEGKFIKSVSKNSEELHNAKPDIISDYSIEEAWGRYDTQGESAMYYSKTFDGNKTEMSYYSDWNSYSTYEFDNVKIDNMLDLTNKTNIEKLGTEFEKLVLDMSDKSNAYEYIQMF